MTIEVCGWRLEPYQQSGRRCWQLFHGRSTRAERYYDTLGGALRFVAEYALRNDEPGVCDLREAIDRYELIAERIESAMGGE